MAGRINIFLILAVIVIYVTCDNLKNGTEVYYFENGDTSRVYNYQNNILNGLFEIYYENGNIKEEGEYSNGVKNGIFKSYFENGNLSEYRHYKNDSIIYAKRFNLQGQIIDGVIGLNISNKTYKEKLHKGEPLELGYSLPHSIANDSYLGLVVVNINDIERDTVIDINSDSNAISYNFTEYSLGTNIYQITVLEVDRLNDIVIGWQMDTLEFEVLP